MVRVQSNIHKKSSYDRANCISKLFFVWLIKFFLEFQKKKLKTSDLEKCPKYEESARIGDKLETNWKEQLKKLKNGGNPSLGWAIIKTFGLHYSFNLILILTSSTAQILQTLCMGVFVDNLYKMTLEDADVTQLRREIYMVAAGIVFSQVFSTYVENMFWFLCRKCGIAVRVACSRLIYQKSLRLSQEALGKTTAGQIVNLLSNDVARFDLASEFPFFLIVGPLQLAASIYILWPMLRVSTFIGITVLFLYIPFQAAMGRAFSRLRTKGAFLTDERVRLMNELIPSMRVIKMYAWEKPFIALVDQARKREVAKIRGAAYLKGVNFSLGTIAEKLIMFLILVSFILLGNHLTAKTVFVAMSLIRQLQSSITYFIPYCISTGAESLISIKRIREFLLLPEQKLRQPISKDSNIPSSASEESKVDYKHVYVPWKQDDESFLKDISFQVSRRQLMTIVGPVGAGKSSLLMSILGEITAKSGEIQVHGKVSYACQQSWIFAGSVKENILFGSEYDAERYKRVVHVSALERDLTILPTGEETVVGDRGASLSGGQRARINLARCLYARADIYLLDDPLSAVDAPVAKHIFEKSIKEFLSDKIAILVTHQLQFIKSADRILYLKNGGQVCFGDYTDFLKKGSEFIQYSAVLGAEQNATATGDQLAVPLIRQLSQRRGRSLSQRSQLSEVFASGIPGSISVMSEMNDEPYSIDDQGDLDTLCGEEEEQGLQELAGLKASKHTLWTYLRAGIHTILFPFWFGYFVGAQLLISFIEYYFSLWSDSEERRGQLIRLYGNDSMFQQHNFVDKFTETQNIYFFAGLSSVLFFWCLTRNIAFFSVLMRSSIKLHDRLFRAVIRAPISFFDNNPPGIILNRISRDMGMVDDFLPGTLFDTTSLLAANAAAIIIMGVVNGFLVLPGILLFVFCILVRSRYVNIARDVKRLEGSTKSPIFSHLSTSLNGLSTIRAFRSQDRFEAIFDMYQDEHSSAYFTWIASSRFFIAMIYTMSICFTSLIVLTVLLAMDSMTGGSVGLVVTSTLSLGSAIQWGMRQLTEVETMMTSVERVDELRHVPPEADLESSPNKKPPLSWPDKGEITFCHVSLKYDSEKPPVLDDLCFKIEPREKVGIVGRTGAGKSSIMSALFRMTEPEGHIIIDGIDISIIGLHELRPKISIIPQEPVIFSGTIRYNLDPFNQKTDSDIWDALNQVQLKKPVDAMGGLDSMVNDGGTNLSVGQRQLMCLARAILAHNKILVLDEATANIDPTTDELIQKTIRTRFVDCTVLTIAHRLQTIMDSDKILVMDAGKVAQFGDPGTLIGDKKGILYTMVQATGKESAENLTQVALKNEARMKLGFESLNIP